MNVALLSSYTVDLIPRETDAQLQKFGVEATWYIAPFNQYRQEMLDANSGSKAFQPDVVLVSLDADELLSYGDRIGEFVSNLAAAYASSSILIHNCAVVRQAPLRLMEWNSADSRNAAAAKINTDLSDAVRKLPRVHILDLESLVMRYGSRKLFDARFHYLAKMEYSASGLKAIAEQLAIALAAIAGKRKKCLVLDLDNTLWGGILGEDGAEHLTLSNDGEGKAFYDFQRHLQRLQRSGILLAVCSKNDEAAALDVIEHHPNMVLRKEDLAAYRINWDDKAKNIAEIAEELSIGLDSFVFLDDSPHERDLVRKLLPEVTVPDLPKDFSSYPEFLVDLPYFETFSITTEDAERGNLYAQERKRGEVQRTSGSVEEFLHSLGIEITVSQATAFTIPRIAQLTQRTNQFNLTTRRYTESKIQELVADPRWIIVSVSAVDAIGDAGIVGAALVLVEGNRARLDTFLMSCRVLGRGIEDAFLAEVLNLSKKLGASSMIAEYIPTKKNIMAKDFLGKSNFTPEGDFFSRNIQTELHHPKWIKLHNANS